MSVDLFCSPFCANLSFAVTRSRQLTADETPASHANCERSGGCQIWSAQPSHQSFESACTLLPFAVAARCGGWHHSGLLRAAPAATPPSVRICQRMFPYGMQRVDAAFSRLLLSS